MPVVDDLDDVRVPGQAERLGLAPQTIARDRVVRGGDPQQLDRDGLSVGDADRLVDDAARARAHAPQNPVLPRATEPSSFAPAPVSCDSLERQAALEGVHARLLRMVLRAPELIAGPDDARERAGRRGHSRHQHVKAERAHVRHERHRAERQADSAADGAARRRVGHGPGNLVLLHRAPAASSPATIRAVASG